MKSATLKVFKAINTYKAKTPPRLMGNGHEPRVMVLPWLGSKIPDALKAYLYFTGQGRLPIISLALAEHIEKVSGIDKGLFSTEV